MTKHISTDSDFGSQSEDMDAINVWMRTTPIVNNAAYPIKDAFIKWWDKLGWYDRTQNGDTYDEARTRRNKFNLANVRNEQERANVAAVIVEGSTTEEMQGDKRPPVFSTGEVGSMTKKPVTATGAPAVTTKDGKPMVYPTIRKGSKDTEAVKKWQSILGVVVDGNFGPKTEVATKTWQKERGLTADGVVGPKTWAVALPAPKEETPFRKEGEPAVSVRPTLKLNSKGPAVSEWQVLVGITPTTGFFGEATKKRTIEFQKARGLPATGIVDAKTWETALKAGPTFAPVNPPVTFAKPPAPPPGPKPAPNKPVASGAKPDAKGDKKKAAKEKVQKVAQASVGFFDFTKWPKPVQVVAAAGAIGGIIYAAATGKLKTR